MKTSTILIIIAAIAGVWYLYSSGSLGNGQQQQASSGGGTGSTLTDLENLGSDLL
jgi:ABC-type antimicrobial peptide transport system permease subunit